MPYRENVGVNANSYAVIQTRVSTRDRCSIPFGQRRQSHTVDLEFRLFTKFSIQTSATKDKKTEHEMKNTTVTHSYELKNMGPSISNSSYKFDVAVPKDLDVTLTTEPNSTVICKLADLRFPDANLNSVLRTEQCNQVAQLKDPSVPKTKEFLRYECEIMKGWEKSISYYVAIKMDFKTNVVPKIKDKEEKEKLSDIFVVPTFVKTKEECVSSKTTFISEELGEILAVKRMWPYFLAIGIAVVLLIALVIICWKYKLFDKLRLYNNKE